MLNFDLHQTSATRKQKCLIFYFQPNPNSYLRRDDHWSYSGNMGVQQNPANKQSNVSIIWLSLVSLDNYECQKWSA